jgi:hypothetical protein
MDPLVSVVIVLAILLALSFGGNVLVFRNGTGAASQFGEFIGRLAPQLSSSTGMSQTSDMFFEFMSLMISFSPNVFFAFGFILDIFNSTYHYSIPSITALCAMILNSLGGGMVVSGFELAGYYSGKAYDSTIGKIGKELPIRPPSSVISSRAPEQPGIEMKPFRSILDDDAGPTTDTRGAEAVLERNRRERQAALEKDRRDAARISKRRQRGGNSPFSLVETCSLPGFAWLENDVAPQGIVMSMTILSYLLYELWDHGLFDQSIGLSVTTGIVFALQCINLIGSGCLLNYRYKNWSILIALIIAVSAGTSSYAIQKRIWGGVLMPSTNSKQTLGTTSKSPFESIIKVGEKSSQSEPVNDQDQFVCEAYKDGELITSTIVD